MQANCLVPSGQPLYGTPDESTYQLTFHTGDQPVHAQKFSHMISPDSEFLGLAELRVFGPPGKYLEFTPTLLPVLRPEVPRAAQNLEKDTVKKKDVHELVSFFTPPLPRETGPFLLIFKEFLKNSVAKLRTGTDRLWITPLPRAAGFVRRMDLVLFVPVLFGPVHLRPDEGAKNYGGPLSGPELDEYKKIAPSGFYPVGWTGRIQIRRSRSRST